MATDDQVDDALERRGTSGGGAFFGADLSDALQLPGRALDGARPSRRPGAITRGALPHPDAILGPHLSGAAA